MSTASGSGRSLLSTLALAAGAVALLGACGSGPAPAGPAPTAPAGNGVTVTMTEFSLALSQQTFAPGAYTFVAKNAGSTLHALEIDGPGVSDQRTAGVPAGQSANLTVNLQNGKYQIYCPIDGHRGMGMETTITVGGAGGQAPNSGPANPPPATTTGSGSGSGYGY